jgi:restriction endonuclease Mrr
MFNELINEIENDKVSLLSSSNLGDFVEKIRTEIHDKIRAELEKMSPNNSDISFENVCRKIIESFGYRCIGNNHHANGGDADLIFTIEDVESDSLNNPFIMKEKKLYVQVKRHHGNSGKKAVEQIVKIIKEDKVESVQGCAITLGVFNEDAEIFAEENEIILINGNELIDLFIERLL